MAHLVSSPQLVLERRPLKHDALRQSPGKQAGRESCHIFRLPLELREEIYRLALPQSRQVATRLEEKHGKTVWPFPLCEWRSGSIALLRTNRQINVEATHVFWTVNTFDVVIDGPHPKLMMWYRHDHKAKDWLSRMQSRALALGRANAVGTGVAEGYMSKYPKELRDCSKDILHRIRRVCILFRRNNQGSYDVDLYQCCREDEYRLQLEYRGDPWVGQGLGHEIFQLRERYAEKFQHERRSHLMRGFDQFSKLVDLSSSERGSLRLEIMFYVYHDLWNTRTITDSGLAKQMSRRMRRYNPSFEIMFNVEKPSNFPPDY